MTPFRHVWHLATRFLGVLLSRPLGPGRQDDVARILTPAEADLFFRQQAMDQRHGYLVAQRVKASLPGNRDAIAAALLHDVGKATSKLGPVARSVATILATVRIPLASRWRAYRDHGTIGAAELQAAGARPLAVGFAAGQPTGDSRVWQALVEADNGPGWGQLATVPLAETPGSAASRNTMPPEVKR
jgi:hypothetical protein